MVDQMHTPDILDRLEKRARITPPSGVWVELTPDEAAYIKRYWERKRYADQKAQESSNRWEARNTQLTEYINRHNRTNRQPMTDQAARNKKDNDWELTDAFSAWHFWQRESARCHGVLTAELTARQLLGLLPL